MNAERRLECAGLLVALLALTVRLAFIFPLWPLTQQLFGLSHGSDGYERVGRTLAAGAGYRFQPHLGETMILPPTYPLFLAGLFRLTGPDEGVQRAATQAAQSILDATTCLMIFQLARRWLTPRAAVAASLIYAMYPGAWIACARYVTEPLFSFLLAALVLALVRWADDRRPAALVAAVALSAATAMCKSVAAPAPVAMLAGVAGLAALTGRLSAVAWRRFCGATALCGLAAGVASGAWLYRNHQVSGAWVFPSTLAGQALYTATVYAANPHQPIRTSVHQAAAEMHDAAAELGIPLDPGDSYPRWFFDARDEVRFDRHMQRVARERIAADSAAFRAHLMGNLWRFWFGAPTSSSVWASIALNAPLMALAGVGLLRARWWREPGLTLWLAAAAYLFVAHVGVLAVVRYSLTVVPVMCVLAAAALSPRRDATVETPGDPNVRPWAGRTTGGRAVAANEGGR